MRRRIALVLASLFLGGGVFLGAGAAHAEVVTYVLRTPGVV